MRHEEGVKRLSQTRVFNWSGRGRLPGHTRYEMVEPGAQLVSTVFPVTILAPSNWRLQLAC